MITITVRVELECDHGPSMCLRQPTVIGGPTEFVCYNQARASGWWIRGRECLCPKHGAEASERLREAESLASTALARRTATLAGARQQGDGR